MAQIVYHNQVKFQESMLQLRKRGGASQRAFDEACRIIKCLEYDADVSHKMTKSGEARIDHCIKYDLSNDHHRLVTVHSDSVIYVLFVGSHEDTDRWLDRHRGLTLTYNPQTHKIAMTHITVDQRREMPQVNMEKLTEANEPYFMRIGLDPAELISQKVLVRSLSKINDNTTDEELSELMEDLSDANPEVANLILDLIYEIREGDLDAASARLDQFQSKTITVQEAGSLAEAAIDDVVNSEVILKLTGLTEEQLKDIFSPNKFHQWMLFLHPEQKRIAEANYDKSVILTGVSGSGKTCVMVHRARYLAKKYPGQKIGVLTLNRSLTRLIESLIRELCTEVERANIHVMAFYDYFETLVRHFGPQAELDQLMELAKQHDERHEITQTLEQVDPAMYAREFDPISGEDIDETWNIFCDQEYVRTLLIHVREHLYKYDDWVNSKKYLREEFSLIRSALPTANRKEGYMSLKRQGRAIPFTPSIRKRVLDLLLLFEETMLSGGILDELALTLSLVPHVMDLAKLPEEMRFRCLLIDEFQDFSTRDLALLRRIPTASENGFFATGDMVQRVMVKDFRLAAVGLDAQSAIWERITKNYRNSRQILQTASYLANEYGEKARQQGEEIEVLDPQLAIRETSYPVAEQCLRNGELKRAWEYARECISSTAASPWSICIVTASPEIYSLKDIQKACPKDFPVKIGQISGDYIKERDTLSVASMVDVKGFEFSLVIIVGCGAEHLPSAGSCKEESWREALHLYVAMTRARDEVRLFYNGEPSQFLLTMSEGLYWEELEQSSRNHS